MASLLILSILYGAAALYYLVSTIKSVVHKGEICIIHCMRFMYAFVYGFLPMLLYYREYLGERNLYLSNYTSGTVFVLYFFFMASVVGYGIICVFYTFFYNHRVKHAGSDSAFEEHRLNDRTLQRDNYLFACGLVTLIIGWISLLLWTRAYGSLANFILNASTIRSGKGSISNSLAFMKHFAYVLIISLNALVAAYIVRKPKGLRRIGYLAAIIAALVGAYVYLLASDSRVTIAYCVVGVILIIIRHRKSENIRRYLVLAFVFALLGLLATMSADSITRYARYHVWTVSDTGLFDSIIREFKFIGRTQQYIADNFLSADIKLKIFDDWVNAIFSWVPERFIPFSLPQTVWTYNTINIAGTTVHGTNPSDLLSTGYYHLNILGLFVYPILFSFFASVADSRMKKFDNNAYTDPYYGFLAGTFIQSVSHSQVSSFVFSLFPLFLYFLVGYLLKLLENIRRIPVSEAE